MIPVLGSDALHPAFGPEALFRAARMVEREHPETGEALDEFAADFATILALPTIEPMRDVPAEWFREELS